MVWFFVFIPKKSRHGVVAAPAPRVAGEDAFYGQIRAFDEAVLVQGLHTVRAASGCVAATGAQIGRNKEFVEFNPEHHQPYDGLVDDHPEEFE